MKECRWCKSLVDREVTCPQCGGPLAENWYVLPPPPKGSYDEYLENVMKETLKLVDNAFITL